MTLLVKMENPFATSNLLLLKLYQRKEETLVTYVFCYSTA